MRDPVSVLDIAPSAQHMAVSLWLTVGPQLASSGGYASSRGAASQVPGPHPVSRRLTAMCRGKATKQVPQQVRERSFFKSVPSPARQLDCYHPKPLLESTNKVPVLIGRSKLALMALKSPENPIRKFLKRFQGDYVRGKHAVLLVRRFHGRRRPENPAAPGQAAAAHTEGL